MFGLVHDHRQLAGKAPREVGARAGFFMSELKLRPPKNLGLCVWVNSGVGRFDLTMRMNMRPFTRLTDVFSIKNPEPQKCRSLAPLGMTVTLVLAQSKNILS
jgi:hypothetical protein